MKLPDFWHHLKARIVGNAHDPMLPHPLLAAEFRPLGSAGLTPQDNLKEYVAKVQLGCLMNAPLDQEEHVRQEVYLMLMRAVYGPVAQELLEIHKDLILAGVRRDNPTLQRIDRMVDTLEPRSINHAQ